MIFKGERYDLIFISNGVTASERSQPLYSQCVKENWNEETLRAILGMSPDYPVLLPKEFT